MLYHLLKIPARLALPLYCKHIRISGEEHLRAEGPLLLAANHPNSFLDAVILATLFRRPVYSLARGDAFTGGWVSRLLNAMKILPVYRISEGAENLNSNYETFSACRAIFKKKGIVLIFSEGLCVNEWALRPLKKGTARLAFSSWNDGIELKVLPVGINYHSFRDFGKSVRLNFGEPMTRKDFEGLRADGNGIKQFNEQLYSRLAPLVDTFLPDDNDSRMIHYELQPSPLRQRTLSLPAMAGKWLHAPLYLPVKKLVRAKAGRSDHYDSILVGLLLLLYPLYLALLASCLFLLAGGWGWLISLGLMPLLAWSYLQIRRPYDHRQHSVERKK